MTERQASTPAVQPSFGQICWQIFEKFTTMEQEMADLKKNGNKLEKENEELKMGMVKLLEENRKLWAENHELREGKADKNTVCFLAHL